MIDKWNIDIGAFRSAQQRLRNATIGEKNTQPWIEQKETNKRLISLIKQLKERVDWLSKEIK